MEPAPAKDLRAVPTEDSGGPTATALPSMRSVERPLDSELLGAPASVSHRNSLQPLPAPTAAHQSQASPSNEDASAPAPADSSHVKLDAPSVQADSSSMHPAGAALQPDQPAQAQAGSGRDLERDWLQLQKCVRARIQPEQFQTWFRRAALVHVDERTVRLAVQNPFTREWLEKYYREVLDRAVIEVFGSTRQVEILVDPELMVATSRRAAPEMDVPPASPRVSATTATASSSGNLFTGELGLNPKYTFDNFVVGPCNRFAHAAAAGAAEQPGKSYNPFFLHGSVGLGKTHLLQSLCFAILSRTPDARILYISCETFVNHFINALETGDLQKFRNKYRSVDVLVVDDIHLLANKERTQEEFFHTFNTLYQQQKQIVLSSDSPPKDIPTLQERLVSRFRWGLVTEIEPPCYETRMAILKRKSREKGREIPDDVARLLSERIDSNIRELEGAVTKLLGYASLAGAPVTTELAREVLRDLFVTRRGAPAMEDILQLVTEHFTIKLSELQSRKRTNAVAYPRQVAMYLARKITRHSLEEIGGFFGGRDHSTVLYAVDKITGLCENDPTTRELVHDCLAKLQAPNT